MENLAKALIKAQSEMPEFKHNATGVHKATYSTLDSIINTARPVLNKNGLAVIQTMKSYENGMISIVTKLIHESGECIDSEMIFNPKPNPQDVGGQITYYRRYAYQSIIGVCTEKDDDADSLIIKKTQKKSTGAISHEVFRFQSGHLKGKLITELTDEQLEFFAGPKNSFQKTKDLATAELAKRKNINVNTGEIPF